MRLRRERDRDIAGSEESGEYSPRGAGPAPGNASRDDPGIIPDRTSPGLPAPGFRVPFRQDLEPGRSHHATTRPSRPAPPRRRPSGAGRGRRLDRVGCPREPAHRRCDLRGASRRALCPTARPRQRRNGGDACRRGAIDARGADAPAGICAAIRLGAEEPRRFCGDWDGLSEAPLWFRTLLEGTADPAPTRREIVYRDRVIGSVAAWPDPVAAAGRIWRQVRVVGGLALALAAATALLGWLAAARLVSPVGRIVQGLEGLDRGAPPLPRFAVADLDRIAAACNRLSQRLARAEAERAELLQRLVRVQEESGRRSPGTCTTISASASRPSPPAPRRSSWPRPRTGRICGRMHAPSRPPSP